MKAVRIEQFGDPADLKIQQLPDPQPSADEVLVQIHAAGINPSDVKNVAGRMEGTTLPRTPGRNFAGIVIEGAAELIGTEVWGTGGDIGFTRDGTHADCIVLPKAAVRPKPQNLTMQLAGSIGVTYVTAWLCVVDAAKIIPGEVLLVIGATGGVGSAAVQIAKWKGASVIGTVRRDSDIEIAHRIGVDQVINLAERPLPQAVLDLTQSEGVNAVVDTVGGTLFEPCLLSLAHKGRLVEISSPVQERRVSFDLIDFYHREARLLGVDSRSLDVTACASILEALTPGFESGAFSSDAGRIETYSIDDAIKAYEKVRDRSASGRVLLTP
jgi:NADPH:quinone reductase-like Zn-dependent oxidoreductase